MAGGSRSQALTRQNAAGWLMALPMVGLLFLFLVVPFFLGFVLSFTNQRLVSPNPTTFVGTANFEQLLGKEQSNMSRVAERAGLERTHLYRKLKQLNIRFSRRSDEGAC